MSRADQPLRYVLIFYGIVYVILGVAMVFLLPKEKKVSRQQSSLSKNILQY